MVRPLLSTIELPHTPAGLKVHVALYRNLKNSRYLRKQLLDQNRDFEYAFIDAKKILSRNHVLAAVFRAINDQSNDRLRSHNVHSEIVVSLNTTNNIGDALRRFGIGDQTTSLLVIKVTRDLDNAAEGVAAQLEHAVEAEPLDFNNAELARLHSLTDIRKTYKVSQPATSKGEAGTKGSQDGQLSDEDLENLEMTILGSMALRGAT